MVKDNVYILNNNFSHRSEEVKNYIQRVFNNSYQYYSDNVYHRGMGENEIDNDLECLLNGLDYLEDYLYYFDKFYPDEFNHIFDGLKNKLEVVSVLPPARRGIYGQFIEEDKLILINPSLSFSSTLTGKERTRLYMCHELGHINNSEWMATVNRYVEKGNLPDYIKQIKYDGFSLIDEATTQDRAEAITYYFAGKRRPKARNYIRRGLFDGEPYRSNFDYYGELEDSAVTFGKTLRGIGRATTDEEALKLLSIRTLDKRFVDKVFYEYENDDQLYALNLILQYLGIIKRASYALFGYADREYIGMSKGAKYELDRIAGPLRDYRKPYNY